MAGVIIHSDDFGYSVPVNEAIETAFRLKLISSTSMLVNFNDGFKDAISRVISGHIQSEAIGIHLNLTQGKPVTTHIQKCKRFVNEGQFCFKRNHLWFLTKVEKTAIYREFEAQLQMMIKNGISPSKIDSHHHIHTEPAVLPIVIQLARQYKINQIRICRNIGSRGNILKYVYRLLINHHLQKIGLAASELFGDINDFIRYPIHNLNRRNLELMVHAKFNSNNQLIDLDGESLLLKIGSLKKRFNTQ